MPYESIPICAPIPINARSTHVTRPRYPAHPRLLVARSTSCDLSPLPVSCACTLFFELDLIRVLSTRANSIHTLEDYAGWQCFSSTVWDSGLESEMGSILSHIFKLPKSKNEGIRHTLGITRLPSNINIRFRRTRNRSIPSRNPVYRT